MPLTFPLPDPLDGALLQQALAEVGIITEVMVDGDGQLLLPDTDDYATAAPVVQAHPAKVTEYRAALQAQATNEQTIKDRAATALQGNRDFLALQTPTNAQVLAQVRALTRQATGLIRLALKRFEGTD